MKLLLNIINYAVAYLFYEKSLTRKVKFEGKHYAIMHGVFCVFLMELTFRNIILHISICILLLLLSSVYYEEIFSTKLILIMAFWVTHSLSKFFTIALLGHLMGGKVGHGFLTISHLQLENMLTCMFTYISVVVWGTVRKNRNTNLPKEIKGILLSVLVLTIIGAYVMYYLLFYKNYKNLYRIFTIMLIVLFGIHYFVLIMVEKLNELMSEVYDGKMKLQEKKFEEEYFYELQEKIRDLRKLRHDYRNQLLALMAVKWEDEEHLEEEIKHFLKKMDQSEKIFYTENYVLNAICKNKFTQARNSGITVNWKITMPSRINMRSNEIGILFGNLIDNAIEACEKVLEERNMILIVSVKDKKMIIHMRNTRNIKYRLEEKQRTTKEDADNHGFGMESVKEIVEKYHGTLHITETQRHYETNIILYGIHGTD